jgi:hypothetical protein
MPFAARRFLEPAISEALHDDEKGGHEEHR